MPNKTKAIRDLCVQYMICADARISHEDAGHKPTPEKENGKDTGRIAHRVTKTGVVILFENEEVHVDFTNL